MGAEHSAMLEAPWEPRRKPGRSTEEHCSRTEGRGGCHLPESTARPGKTGLSHTLTRIRAKAGKRSIERFGRGKGDRDIIAARKSNELLNRRQIWGQAATKVLERLSLGGRGRLGLRQDLQVKRTEQSSAVLAKGEHSIRSPPGRVSMWQMKEQDMIQGTRDSKNVPLPTIPNHTGQMSLC